MEEIVQEIKTPTNPYSVDHQEAERYEMLSKHFEKVRYHYPGVDSEGNELPIIDLAKFENKLEEETESFPEEERELVKIKKRALKTLQSNISHARRKAFGVKESKKVAEYTLNDRDDELIALFGKFMQLDEVHKIVNVEWGLPVPERTLATFREKNYERIKAEQENYKSQIDDIRLVHKRGRLEEYLWLFNKVKDKIELNDSMDAIKELSNILEKVKKEVEGDRIVLEGNIEMQIKNTIDIHTQKEVLDRLSLMQILIGRISAKQGINPEFMINRLIRSSYAKFSGFGGADMDEMKSAEIFLPSQLANYNFEDILKNREKLLEEEKKAKIIDITPVEDKGKFNQEKNALIDIINRKKKEIGSKEDTIDNAGKS